MCRILQQFSGNVIPELNHSCLAQPTIGFCPVSLNGVLDSNLGSEGETIDIKDVSCDSFLNVGLVDKKPNVVYKKPIDFTKIDAKQLPTVMIIGRPNVGKSALYNRLIRRREALVYNTPDDHVTRDIREGIAKLGDLRFNVLDSAGIETEVSSGTILGRTTSMTANVLARTQFAVLIIDVRVGLHPLDLEVGKWLRKHVPQIKPIVVMNKSESLGESLAEVASEADVILPSLEVEGDPSLSVLGDPGLDTVLRPDQGVNHGLHHVPRIALDFDHFLRAAQDNDRGLNYDPGPDLDIDHDPRPELDINHAPGLDINVSRGLDHGLDLSIDPGIDLAMSNFPPVQASTS